MLLGTCVCLSCSLYTCAKLSCSPDTCARLRVATCPYTWQGYLAVRTMRCLAAAAEGCSKEESGQPGMILGVLISLAPQGLLFLFFSFLFFSFLFFSFLFSSFPFLSFLFFAAARECMSHLCNQSGHGIVPKIQALNNASCNGEHVLEGSTDLYAGHVCGGVDTHVRAGKELLGFAGQLGILHIIYVTTDRWQSPIRCNK